MKNVYKLVIGLLVIFAVNACTIIIDEEDEIIYNGADLEVHVYGAITHYPREDIKVSLHWTEEEALDNVNPIVGYAWTDYNGNVFFYNIPPDEVYWIRAKTLLTKTIKRSQYVLPGYNYESVPVY